MTDRPNIEALADEAYHWAAALSLADTRAGRNEFRAKHRAAIDGLRAAALAAQAAAVPQDAIDATRYRWLRSQTWDKSELSVVRYPKRAVKLGFDCPSETRLDEAIDTMIAAAPPAPAPVEPNDAHCGYCRGYGCHSCRGSGFVLASPALVAMPTMVDALAAGDRTLHNTIDRLQARVDALTRERDKWSARAIEQGRQVSDLLSENTQQRSAPAGAQPLTYTLTPAQVSALCVEICHRTPSNDWMDEPLNAVRALLDADHTRIHHEAFNALEASFHGITGTPAADGGEASK